MRVLVVAPTSGQSCRALDTVMTDTPAFSAMSLRRTIFCLLPSYRSPPPLQFAPQGFTKRAARQVHQTNDALAAPDGDDITRGELANDLAIGAEDGGGLGAVHGDGDGRGQWDD